MRYTIRQLLFAMVLVALLIQAVQAFVDRNEVQRLQYLLDLEHLRIEELNQKLGRQK